MWYCRYIVNALLFAGGLLSAALLGVCLLVIWEYKPIPQELCIRHDEGTRFHVISARQMLLEDNIQLGVIEDAIAHLKKTESFCNSIAGLEILRTRLQKAGRESAAAIKDTLTSDRVYVYCNDRKTGYVQLPWFDSVIGTAVKDETERPSDMTSDATMEVP